jgi:pyrroloquinoline quinone biosynthesis protein B
MTIEQPEPSTGLQGTSGAAAGAEAVLLGTAQDGGLPQPGCTCANCSRAWADQAQRQRVVCLGLVDHTTRQTWLIDATPDFREQLHALRELAPGCSLSGILLTHAHIGHYAGLIHLGRESMSTKRLPVYASERMAGFLRDNAPWSQLVEQQNIELRSLVPGESVSLSRRLQVEPVPVPHRDEFSDTLAFVVQGPSRRLFYCPDIDDWQIWERDLRSCVAAVDVALLDGTFWDDGDLPGRDIGEVAHPLVPETVARLAGVPSESVMIHLNHSNPLFADGPERQWLAGRGVKVGAFGQRWRLG